MLTKREKEWLISHYTWPRLFSYASQYKLTDIESSLVRRGLAVVVPRDSRWKVPRKPRSIEGMCIILSVIGENYIIEHALFDLLFYMFNMKGPRQLDRLIRELPTERFPELLICESADIRFKANQEMNRRSNAARCSVRTVDYIS